MQYCNLQQCFLHLRQVQHSAECLLIFGAKEAHTHAKERLGTPWNS